MTDYRVLVTGSRDWTNRYAVEEALHQVSLTALTLGHERLVVVHGACPSGADLAASDWAKGGGSLLGFPVMEERHPAKWDKHLKQAGFIRNQEMVDAGAHYCLAFISPCTKKDCPNREPHGSHGTTDCVIRAVRARIPGRQYT